MFSSCLLSDVLNQVVGDNFLSLIIFIDQAWKDTVKNPRGWVFFSLFLFFFLRALVTTQIIELGLLTRHENSVVEEGENADGVCDFRE